MSTPTVDRLAAAVLGPDYPDDQPNPHVTCRACFMPAPRQRVSDDGVCIDCAEPDRPLASVEHRYPKNIG